MKNITKTSQLLREAKKILAKSGRQTPRDGERKHRYICTALREAAKRGGARTWVIRAKLQGLIHNRLAPHISLEWWMRGEHGVEFKHYPERGYIAYSSKMQRTRHAWVDSLIEEFKAKGD